MLDNTKIYIIDFEDSFTFNIASELYFFEKKIEVVSNQKFFLEHNFEKFLKNINNPVAVILGPGPGSPEQYRHYFKFIKKLQNNKNVFMMGICLGHQVIGLIDGLSIGPSSKPIHGGQIPIVFKGQNLLVQRYNSLAVFHGQNDLLEINIRNWPRGISYQFHPESIGTENPSIFFKDLLDFIL